LRSAAVVHEDNDMNHVHPIEQCDECNTDLEQDQIGLCEDCMPESRDQFEFEFDDETTT